ncbi:MAG TPA: hypothetical protein VK633_04410 [Verrucomicrobiae bacterium]|nr:hypothetical protein [Verrucomicrobiae bacterium]
MIEAIHNRWVVKPPLLSAGRSAFGILLCSVLLDYSATRAGNFPIETFKNFINGEVAVESLDFKYRMHLTESGPAAVDSTRTFRLVYENPSSFLITEKCDLNGKVSEESFGSYHGFFWSDDDRGGQQWRMANFKIGVHLLKLGLPNLGTNKLEWTELNFLCRSNEIGARLSGVLKTNTDGRPTGMNFEILYQGQSYPYEISYNFDHSESRPAFFPSRVTLRFTGRTPHPDVADFEVTQLLFSTRPLSFQDVGLLSPLNKWYLDSR